MTIIGEMATVIALLFLFPLISTTAKVRFQTC
jgi:hypothetical protein